MKSNRFKQTRKDLNLTQRQLAKELGLSEKNGDRYIRGIESGDREASGLLLRCLELLKFYNTYHKIKQDIQERYDANKN